MRESVMEAMTHNTPAPISIWRQVKAATKASLGVSELIFPAGRQSITVLLERAPVSNLTAGQGKIRMAG